MTGSRYPNTGYELTFLDFRQLISHSAYRDEIAPLIRSLLDCELAGVGDATEITSATGEHVDAQELHETIQSDPLRQRKLYNVAMSLWR